MNFFKIGTAFDLNVIDEVERLNEQYLDKSLVSEFYGSIACDSTLAARPAFRLPDISRKQLEEFVKKSNDIGVSVNYTLNSMLPFGSKMELVKNKQEIISLIKYLESIGVKLITVANPILLEIIKEADTKMKIEISTCAHIDTLSQIKFYSERYGISKVCGNLLKNRNFNFLKAANKLCEGLGISYELMVNEFCGVGGDNYATHCIYRDSCYLCHATNTSYEDMQALNNYPMNICTSSRNKNPANWLKSQFIRPEDLQTYRLLTGINHFKITGRTGSTEYQIKMLEAYMSEHFDGDLLELWKPLETIQKKNENENVDYRIIDNNKLDGFINHWVVKGHDCSEEVCGETCNYCNKFYEKFN